MRRLFDLTTIATLSIVAALTTATLLGTLADEWWLGQLLSQPRPQYALALLICLPVLLARFRRAGWLVLVPLVANVASFAPLYVIRQPVQSCPTPQRCRTTGATTLLHYNLDNSALDHEPAFAYLREHPVDVLSLQELTPDLDRRLSAELPGYRVAYSHPMSNSHGSALLLAANVDIDVISATIIHLPAYSVRPIIAAVLSVDGHEVAFLNLHVIRPVGEWNSAFQQIEFAAAADWSREQQRLGRAVLVAGDLNAAPWSSHFRRLSDNSGLLDSAQGFGPQPTWPAFLPPLLAIPIDHCLHSPEIVILNRHTGPSLGSDHAPLHVQFALTREGP